MNISQNSRAKNLVIPWARNKNGEPQRAGDPSLKRGLSCECRCPNCDDQLVHRNGAIKRPHFAHYSKQPIQSCFESSIHLAYKNAFLGTEGSTFKLPTTPEPTAMGKEPWRMDPDLTVACVSIEAPIQLPEGTSRIADVIIIAEDGRHLAIEIAVTNPKDEEYSKQMESISLPAVEHRATVQDPDDEIPSPAEILRQAHWLWEPYSGPLQESMEARRIRDKFLVAETQLQGSNRMTQTAALQARQDPLSTYKKLSLIERILNQIDPVDDVQKSEQKSLKDRISNGLSITHGWVEATEKKKYQDLN